MSVRRSVRRYDSIFRFLKTTLMIGCLVTIVTWMWSLAKGSWWCSRNDGHLRQLTFTSALQFMQQEAQVCPPCPAEGSASVQLPIDASLASNTDVINCSINDQEFIECRRDGTEVYMPVSFINKYFDVYGTVRVKDNVKYYEFQYSYGKVFPPQPTYHPGGVFLNFEKYYVEAREKIKCVTAVDGVPLASQWDPNGYYYAISVAQYGLSHHAKSILFGNPAPEVIATGHNYDLSKWTVPARTSSLSPTEVLVEGQRRRVLVFNAPESHHVAGPTIKLNTALQALCLDVFMTGPGGVTVKIVNKLGSEGYIHFIQDDAYMIVEGNHVTYGMGTRHLNRWLHLARDLSVDWMKSLGPVKYNSPNLFFKIVDVTLHGNGYLDNLTVAANAHIDHLIHSADWLVNNQDPMGGWPTEIGMRTGDIQLKPGWYSAMGQGQAMSTLVRAYNVTGEKQYLTSAIKGLHLYELGSEEGGVRARFLGQLDWYEEYPTTPTSTFVLNGFIFSMLGLYDVMKTVDGESQQLSEKLWNAGLKSLKIMIGMYDSGTGTLYDLRHVINHEQPNRARWDYHTTHIALVQEMAIIDGDPIFHQTANRWIDYMYGIKSKHN
ncbi:D-glucuronyl C5-epimerase B-like [Biomphalaria glabrata]|uniref:heparosan-N-sulfate-glucuronate 5-epimerase n=1 Tax=Biomphalaria glabrata TaxID=6526 RepID=A0A9W2YMG1_BIOGL|nr:D-glucuronyl C5-epimerase B-like [Biomphalaria glabrata]XP_055863851.1 D-glucuronyl C5-epimerase B-like [Biomphalaria glabrata]